MIITSIAENNTIVSMEVINIKVIIDIINMIIICNDSGTTANISVAISSI